MPHPKKAAGAAENEKITALVLKDHETVKKLYADIQKSDDQHGDPLFQKMCWEIALHAVAEELILYPLQEAMDKQGKEIAAESRADHEKTKEALRELDGKSLKESGVREKVDLMMKDLVEHMEKEETEDLVKLETLGDEKLIVAGNDFQQAKKLIPDVAPSNQAHSNKDADKADQDSHFKTPMALLSASIEKLQQILGTHGKGESVSVNMEHRGGGHKTQTHHGESGVKAHSGEESGAKGDDGADGHYNLRHRDDKGHVVPDEEDKKADSHLKNGGSEKAANGGGHEASGNGKEESAGDGDKHHGKRSKGVESPDSSSRKKIATDTATGHEADAGKHAE